VSADRRRNFGVDPGPQHIGGAMDKLLKRMGGSPSVHVMQLVFEQWRDIAGPDCADHVQPLRVQGNTLTVGVEHPAWATRARMESAEMLARLRDLGDSSIERIEVVVQRP
jgi:predicted nucleic acid-binding Zn ribbon protein